MNNTERSDNFVEMRHLERTATVTQEHTLPSRIDNVYKLSIEKSEKAADSAEATMTDLLAGMSISDIGKKDPHVSKILGLLDRAESLAKELIETANKDRDDEVSIFFAEKALDMMKNDGIVPALITIPEDSKWGKQTIQLLELLDPEKNVIRSRFKVTMSKSIAVLHNDECCRYCCWPRAELLVCGACKAFKYCSRKCQKSDWRRHKKTDCHIKI